jgi:hypothetical protein
MENGTIIFYLQLKPIENEMADFFIMLFFILIALPLVDYRSDLFDPGYEIFFYWFYSHLDLSR